MKNYPPMPDAIRQGCAEIQAGWSAEVEAARRYNPSRIAGRVDGWLPPGCTADSAGVKMSIVFDRQKEQAQGRSGIVGLSWDPLSFDHHALKPSFDRGDENRGWKKTARLEKRFPLKKSLGQQGW